MKKIKQYRLLAILTITVFALGIGLGAEEPYPQEELEVNGFIILPHAAHNEIAGIPYDSISLLGACNPDFPLYINGTEVPITRNGYFSFYTQLEMGENLFTFENERATAELTVKRITPTPPGQIKPPIIFDEPVYAVAKNTIISRFYERDDDNKGGTPLVKGTVFGIVAEDAAEDGLYRLHDGSYIFKNSADFLDIPEPEFSEPLETLENPAETLDSLETSENPDEPEIPEISLYSVEMGENSLTVTLHGIEEDEEITYEIPYQEGRTVTGYTAEIVDGVPKVRVRYALTDLSKATVLIDAGHGGTDPGALGPPGDKGLMEKDFNLYVAEKTRDYLNGMGVSVIFPRPEDKHVPALERMENFTERLDMTVSIHANSMPMQRDFWGDEGPLMFYSLENSEQAANFLLEHITNRLINETDYSGRSRGIPKAEVRNFGLTRYTGAPAMLFEMGYVCNPGEYERMLNTDYLDLIAEALGEGIMQYLSDIVQEEFDGVPEYEEEPEDFEEEEAEIPEEEPEQTIAPAVTRPAETVAVVPVNTSLRLKTGDIAFLAAILICSVIRIVYELKK